MISFRGSSREVKVPYPCAEVAGAQDEVDLARHQQRLELGWQICCTVRDVQVTDA
jgi:hypothetical protein